ncbi:hypothetical protein [Halofilum ochraceum]|uniref:hypothetical protein n=1 Tax=Halofilum ochraceum TaxID=1611323 RepID=UPI0008DA6795|nr:hypothetical protein [Halofilum ochraceum]
MRIDRIEATAYLGLAALDLAPATAVTLIAGPNGAGKSSLAEVIRHALLGRATRVTKKGDYKLLLTHGHKNGQGKVTWAHGDTGGVAGFKLPKGDEIKGANLPQLEGLDIALGATPFMQMADKDRRGVLMRATGIQAKPKDVGERLKQRGVEATVAEEVAPMLRSGFDAGRQYAEQNAKNKEQEWRQITGEQYGTNKAEDWEASAPERPAVEALEEAANERNEVQIALRQAIDDQIQVRDERLSEAYERQKAAKAKLAGETPDVHPCPSCGQALTISNEGLHVHDGGDEPVHDQEAAREEAEAAGQAISGAQNERSRLQQEVGNVDNGRPVQATLYSLGVDSYLLERYDKALAALEELNQQAEAHDSASGITERAAKAHKAAKQYRVAEAALKPDGIPTDLVTEAIRPINDRLSWSSHHTGWPLVQIDTDCALTIGGHPYPLASESERWRADILMAEALAYATGLRCFMYDRVDVLSPQNRTPLIRWLDAIAADYDSIIVLGTFRQAPDNNALPASVTAYWIDGGDIHHENTEAAA